MGKIIFNVVEFFFFLFVLVVDKVEVLLNKIVLIDDILVEKLKIKNILILI